MNINFTAPFCDTSYGLVGLNTLRELILLGHTVSIFPIGGQENINGPECFHEFIRAGLANAHKNLDYNAPSVRLWHQFDLAQHIGNGKRIGWPIFELDSFNQIEKNHIYNQQHVIVCSSWAKDIILDNAPQNFKSPVSIVPLGYDPEIFSPQPNKIKKTVFINVGKKELRKGHDIILECFEKAFTQDDDVALWMVWGNRILDYHNKQESASWTDIYNKSKLKDKICTQWECKNHTIIGHNLSYTELNSPVGASFAPSQNNILEWLPTQKHLAMLFNMADCAIFPSRAEGFNLDALEAMACNLPIIITDYSAHQEYANEYNALLVNVDNKEKAYDGIWFFGQGNWAELGDKQKDQIIDHMRFIHKTKKETGSITSETAKTVKDFTWKKTATELIKAIQL